MQIRDRRRGVGLWLLLAFLLSTPFAGVCHADINAWTVASGTNDWYGDTNYWSLTHFPLAGEDVVITNAGVGVLLTNSAPASGSFNSMVISNTTTLVFSNWDTALSATDVKIQKSAIVTCAGPFTNAPDMSNRVYLICSNLTIDGGGQINVDAKGYRGGGGSSAPGSGPGGGGGDSNGGSHGGFSGGDQRAMGKGFPYDDPFAPLLPGSGGGASGNPGGHGGGAVRVSATGRVLVNGIITANGGPVNGIWAGGGSGGAVFITCNTIGGTNVIQVNGGNSIVTQPGVMGGAGGRIAVDYDATAQGMAPMSSIVFSSGPGAGYSGGQLSDIGTVHFPDTRLLTEPINVSGQIVMDTLAWTPDRLTVSNNWIRFPQEGFQLAVSNDVTISGVNGRLELGASVLTNFNTPPSSQAGFWKFRFFAAATAPVLLVGGNLTLANGGSLCVYSAPTNGGGPAYGSLVDVTANMTVGAGCWVYAYSHWTNGGSPLFRMRSLSIATNAGFKADGGGFAGGNAEWPAGGVNCTGYGPGAGRKESSDTSSGGSYGGLGGRMADTAKTYGSSNAPAMPGSGGGSGGTPNVSGGFGGGQAQIVAQATVALDGMISANGDVGTGNYRSGGSGGGVYLRCRKFIGSTNGILRASGGPGSINAWIGGGGGGGRIAVWRMFDGSSGMISNTAAGGVGVTGSEGTNGTVFWGWLKTPGTVIELR